MKTPFAYLLICIFAYCFILVGKVSAQNIQTGNSNDSSTVETNIEGSGNVQTHIEVNANGDKKVLDTTGPGKYKVEVNSNNNYKTSVPEVSTPSASTSSVSAKNTAQEENHPSTIANVIKNFRIYIQDFFKQILNALKLDRVS